MPLLRELNNAEQSFSQVLEDQVRKSIGILLSKQQKTAYPDPNESTLLTLPPLESTLCSLGSITRNGGEVMQPQPTDDPDAENGSAIPQEQTLSSKRTLSDSCTLVQGQILSKNVDSMNTTPIYAAGPLNVQIEYSTDLSLNSHKSRPRKLNYDIKWLTVEEAEGWREQGASFIDAESIEGEISSIVGDRNYFFLAAEGSVVKVIIYPSNEAHLP